MKIDKFRLEDVFPSQDGSLKLILIDREGDKHILHYPKSYEHIYFNDMYFFMNQGYIILDNDCVSVNPIILTDDMVGKQVQLLNGKVYTVRKYNLDSQYKIGDYIYDCFGHGRVMPTTEDSIPLTYHVLGPVELKYDPSLNSAFRTIKSNYTSSPIISFNDYLDIL